MKNIFFLSILVLTMLIIPIGNVMGWNMADVDCIGTEETLVYDCIVKITEKKTNKKIDGAKFKVGAEMPSMPGAHNVKPVIAHSIGNGIYHVRLELEMFGEWILKMDFTKPRRDRIVKKIIFGKNGHGMSHDHDAKHNKNSVMEISHENYKKNEHNKEGKPMKHKHND